ncbi:hypothetical protein [Desulfuromonas sp.]|nr:hypothetical protein [Desulfuromonas sp.]
MSRKNINDSMKLLERAYLLLKDRDNPNLQTSAGLLLKSINWLKQA